MPIDVKITEHVIRILVLSPRGRLDAFEAPSLRKVCDEFVSQGAVHFVFDLRETSMLDSAGLAVLVNVLKRTRLAGGDVRLIWPVEEAASRILKLTKFDQVFTSIEPDQVIPTGF